EERLALDQPALAPLLDRLRHARAALAQVAQAPPREPTLQADWVARLRQREAAREQAETDLAVQSAAFRRARSITPAAVADALPPQVAFVDLLEYTHVTPAPTHKGRYLPERRFLAFVLAKGSDPVVVPLGPAQPLDEAVAAWREAGRHAQVPDD